MGRSQRNAGPRSSGWRPIVASALQNAVLYAPRPSTATHRGLSVSTFASSFAAPSRSSELFKSLAVAVTRSTRFVMPIPSAGRQLCSAGERTVSVNPPAHSNFQNRFPGRAKWRPSSPESVPGLIPQKRTCSSGPTRSANRRSASSGSCRFVLESGSEALQRTAHGAPVPFRSIVHSRELLAEFQYRFGSEVLAPLRHSRP